MNDRARSAGHFALTCLAAAVCGVPAQAQQSAAPGDGAVSLEEVVVTARRRDEGLLEVPLSVSAMTAEDLAARSIVSLDELSMATPSMYATTQVGGGSGRNSRASRRLVFRGLSTSDGQVFFDGAPISGSLSPLFGDVERVEVLRGPQSVYFGRNTFTGAINYVSKTPSMEKFGGNARVEFSEYDSRDITVALEGPILEDVLSARVSVRDFRQGGHYDNFADPDVTLGDRSTQAISAQVAFQPTERLTIKSFFTYFEDDDGPGAQTSIKQPEMPCDAGGTRGNWVCGTIPSVDDLPPYTIGGNYEVTEDVRASVTENRGGFYQANDITLKQDFGFAREATQFNIRADYSFDNGYQLSYLGSWYDEETMSIVDLNFRPALDADLNPVPNYAVPPGVPGFPDVVTWGLGVTDAGRNLFHELRLSSPQDRDLRWTAGITYLEAEEDGGSVYGWTIVGDLFANTATDEQRETPAIFAGVYYDLTDDLTLTLEGRFQRDEIRQQQRSDANGNPVDVPGLDDSWDTFSPRVSVDWQFTPEHMVYALWARGYSPGGFNAGLREISDDQLAAVPGVGITFDEEQLDNYEIGLKSSFLGGRANTVLTAYYMDWSDGIVTNTIAFITDDGTLNLQSLQQNLGQVDLHGVEFEGRFALTEELTLSGMFAYNATEINEYVCTDCVFITGEDDAVGNDLRQAPEFNYSLSADYQKLLGNGNTFFARLDYNYRDDYYVTDANVAKVGSLDIVNGRIGMGFGEDLTVEAFGLNMLDNQTAASAAIGNDVLFAFGAFTEMRVALPRRQQFGVRVNYTF